MLHIYCLSNYKTFYIQREMGKDSFSPLMSILHENKLTGPNYVDWKRNLDILLTAENYKYVLIENCPKLQGSVKKGTPFSYFIETCLVVDSTG